MPVVEVILVSIATVLTGLMYGHYSRLSRLAKRMQARSEAIDELNRLAQKRFEEAMAFQKEALQIRDKAIKEAERIGAYWQGERLN